MLILDRKSATKIKNRIPDNLIAMKKLKSELLKYQISVKVFFKKVAGRSKQQIIDVENRFKLLETTKKFTT